MKYFYARTSTKKQKIESQLDLAIEQGIKPSNIFKEQVTGTGAEREQWNKLKNKVKKGDTIIFQSIDRMSRNAEQGEKDYFDFIEKEINLKFIMESHLDSDVFKNAMDKQLEKTGNKLADGILSVLEEYFKDIAKEQITLAFKRAEEEAIRIKAKVLRGLVTTNKKSGRKKGCIASNRKDVPINKILKLSKKFNGNLNNTELSKFLGISRPTLNNWLKEI